MIQECQDRRGIEIGQVERRHRLPQPPWEVGQQEAEGIAVGFDGAWTHTLLLNQSAAEEILDQDIEGRSHEASPFEKAANCSKRWPASANSSGMPSKYQ